MATDLKTKFDRSWFSEKLGIEIIAVEWGESEKDRWVSDVLKVNVEAKTEQGGVDSMHLILKRYICATAGGTGLISDDFYVSHGLKREVDFYNSLETMTPEQKDIVDGLIPRVFFAENESTTGGKIMLMEDVSRDGICPYRFFGEENPYNRGKEDLIRAAWLSVGHDESIPFRIVAESAVALAKFHAAFWITSRNRNVIASAAAKFPWARGGDWILGTGRERWQAITDGLIDLYERVMTKGELPISADVLACLKACYGNMSWENFQRELSSSSLTLQHGDFHAGNIMWIPHAAQNVKMFDWENVGWGSGPAELGHFYPAVADSKAWGKEQQLKLVRIYYEALVSANAQVKDVMDFDHCWKQFVLGGFRWHLLFLPFVEQDPGSGPYYFDQYDCFVKIHDIKPDDIVC